MFIKPEGFDEMHDRHGSQHRLKDECQVEAAGDWAGGGEELTEKIAE